MKRYLLLFLLLPCAALAAAQNVAAIKSEVAAFVKSQTTNLPGEVVVEIGTIDPNLSVPACPHLVPFLASGSKLWGNSTIGVKCEGKWTVYVPVKVRVMAMIVVSARPLSQGLTIKPSDILLRKEDLASAPPGILTDMNEAIGKTLATSIASGYPVSAGMLKAPLVIRPGQLVKLISTGPGFQVTSSGIALGSASEGQTVQVRTTSGQIVSGTAGPGGIVEVTF